MYNDTAAVPCNTLKAVPDKAPVACALDKVADHQEAIQQRLSALRIRLDPVLCIQPPAPSNSTCSPRLGGASPLHDALLSVCERAQDQVDQIEDILRRLAV